MLFFKARWTWGTSISPLLLTRLMPSLSGKKSVRNGITTRRDRKWPRRVRARARASHQPLKQHPALQLSDPVILVLMKFVLHFPPPFFALVFFQCSFPLTIIERPISQSCNLPRPSPRTTRTRIPARILSRRSGSGAPRSKIISGDRRVSRKNRR